MLPFGSSRTYSGCRVLRAYAGKARKVTFVVKSRKRGRKYALDFN